MKRIISLLICSLLSAPVFAHKLNVFAFVEGDNVNVEGYFSDGIPARNAKVTVTDQEGNVINEGQASEKGQYQFSTGNGEGLLIKINAGMGHVASYLLDKNASSASAVNSQSPKPDSQRGGASVEELQQAVAEAIKPLAREISELKQKSHTSDIVGGIGFIMGILGLFAYLKYRKESKLS